MLKHFRRLFVSNTCFSCENDLTAGEEAICLHCLSQIERTNCHLQPINNELFFRFAGKVKCEGAACLYYFDKKGKLQTLIQAMKYKDAPQLAIFFGKCLAEELQGSNFIREVDMLVPVPLHRSKKIKRGYNQAEYIAMGMSEILDIPVDTKSLSRTRKTLTQTRKSGLARWDNVSGAFQASQSPGKNLLIIDDIITTGSTLEACIHPFVNLESPPDSVKVAGIAMARKG